MPAAKPASKAATQDLAAQDKEIKSEVSGKENGEKQTKDPERRSSTVGAQRMGNLRNKFESGAATEKKKNKKKSAPKMNYAGVESAKTKFIEEASKVVEGPKNGPRGPKEFTPPPEGVAVGVLESQPAPRAPDVVTADDQFEPVDLKVIGDTTKALRQKFKNLEAGTIQLDDEEKQRSNSLVDEVKTVAPEATRSARARWKDIESGKVEKEASTDRPKVDIHEGYGGVYENEPEKFENIARAGDNGKHIPAGLSAKERREQFLKNASESVVVKKEAIKLTDLAAPESGIYENEPTRLDGVVRYDDELSEDYPPPSAKWASEAKNRFMQEASKAQERVHRTEPVVVVDNDVDGSDAAGREARYATQAKQAFLERQKQAEEAAKNKSRPAIIDIWGEKCADSGVFENTPAAHSADVVVSYNSEESEEEEEE